MRQLFILSVIMLSSCGFQLRGSVSLPPELAEMYVVTAGPETDILFDLRAALRDRGVRVTEAASMKLVIRNESNAKRVLSVDSQGHATEYGLSYKVRFRLQATDGTVWLPDELISIQRDLRFDTSAVLATSGEETLLEEEMRRDAVTQILHRLQYVKPPAQDAMNKVKEK